MMNQLSRTTINNCIKIYGLWVSDIDKNTPNFDEVPMYWLQGLKESKKSRPVNRWGTLHPNASKCVHWNYFINSFKLIVFLVLFILIGFWLNTLLRTNFLRLEDYPLGIVTILYWSCSHVMNIDLAQMSPNYID